MVTLSTIINPVPFHKPPPSLPAVFILTVPPTIVAFPGPVMCNPPPLPGDMATVLLSKITSVRFKVPVPMVELSSIPPPARCALFPVMVIPVALMVPPRTLRIPPPLPVAPSAMLLVMVVPLISSSVPPLL